MKLHGIFPSITTPFDHKGDLWEIKVRHNIEKWNRTTLSGYVVCGSAGESPQLASAEKIRMWEWVAGCSGPEKLLIAGTGTAGVRETVELGNRAGELGYKLAMVRTPRKAHMAHFRSVADQAKIPIAICNDPPETGVDISAGDILALSQHPNIIAVQESSVEKIAQIVRQVKAGFQVLAGSALTVASSLAAGAGGAVLSFANAAPYAAISIWEAHRTREVEAALDWQSRIACAAQLVEIGYGVPGLKYAMDLNGYYGGPPRLPLAAVTPEERQAIEQAFYGIKG